MICGRNPSTRANEENSARGKLARVTATSEKGQMGSRLPTGKKNLGQIRSSFSLDFVFLTNTAGNTDN